MASFAGDDYALERRKLRELQASVSRSTNRPPSEPRKKAPAPTSDGTTAAAAAAKRLRAALKVAGMRRAAELEVLGLLAARLHAQRETGSGYYLGDALTAVDVYSATFTALLSPLPPEHCPMPDALRAAMELKDDATAAALDPILLEHRDRIYAEHLELPLTL